MNRIGALGVALLAGVIVLYLALAWLGYLGGPGASPAVPTPTLMTTATAAAAVGATDTPVAVLVGAGDIADCNSPGDEATADLIEGIPGTVFTLGDNAYENGTAEEFTRCYGPSWGRPEIKDRTRPVAGNHEYDTPGAAGYFGYFGSAAGDPEEGWYAFDHGAWRVYVLNSNCEAVGGCDRGSPQEAWLRKDLADQPRTCALAMWHHPRFSSGRHGSSLATRDLWRALYAAGAELVLSGHDHHYERFAPQSANGDMDVERGLIQLVVGTGGRVRYPYLWARPNSLVREDDTWGVLRLELSDDSYEFDFVPVVGGTFEDSGSGTCH